MSAAPATSRREAAVELNLPLGDGETPDLGARRYGHLMALPGVDAAAAARLARAFQTLGGVYAAPRERLAAVVGAEVAARIRWFVDAPLGAGRVRSGPPRWRTAA